jgi:hypothetical protein
MSMVLILGIYIYIYIYMYVYMKLSYCNNIALLFNGMGDGMGDGVWRCYFIWNGDERRDGRWFLAVLLALGWFL